jgi:hypothetical protein
MLNGRKPDILECPPHRFLCEKHGRHFALLCCTGHNSRYRPRLGLRRLPYGTLRGAFGKFFHAVEDNLRQLNYLLTQFGVFRNIALNTVAIGL